MTTSVPLFWRLREAKYRMIGTRCGKCGALFFPPRNLCPKCRRRGKIEPFRFSGNGKIFTYTIIRTPPEGFERQAPYAVAIIRLDEGVDISGQVIGDLEKIESGKSVRAVFRKIQEEGEAGIINYGLKFQLAD